MSSIDFKRRVDDFDFPSNSDINSGDNGTYFGVTQNINEKTLSLYKSGAIDTPGFGSDILGNRYYSMSIKDIISKLGKNKIYLNFGASVDAKAGNSRGSVNGENKIYLSDGSVTLDLIDVGINGAGGVSGESISRYGTSKISGTVRLEKVNATDINIKHNLLSHNDYFTNDAITWTTNSDYVADDTTETFTFADLKLYFNIYFSAGGTTHSDGNKSYYYSYLFAQFPQFVNNFKID